MSSKGLSKTRLKKMHEVLAGHVERGDLPGLVTLVSRHGDVHVETIGTLAFDESAPMKRDTIFRIASLSKVVTAVAAMMLLEECRFKLDDPVDRWLPELADRRVLKSISSEVDETVPAKRPISVRDLLTYRMGFGSVMARPGTYPIQKLIRDNKIGGDGFPHPAEMLPMNKWLRKLGELPLLAQPGERWMYHVSGDVLGAFVARVSGRTLGEFMRERIFEPLGMKDTGFDVPAEKTARLPDVYQFDYQENKVKVFDAAGKTSWAAPAPFESGGGGLVSTIEDYYAFSRMLLERGRSGRRQLLSRRSVELMTSDQLTPANREGAEIFFGAHGSWGLGLSVDIRQTEIYQTPGRFGWDGGLGTSAYVDPAEDMIGMLFTQRTVDSPAAPALLSDFWTLAYGAIK